MRLFALPLLLLTYVIKGDDFHVKAPMIHPMGHDEVMENVVPLHDVLSSDEQKEPMEKMEFAVPPSSVAPSVTTPISSAPLETQPEWPSELSIFMEPLLRGSHNTSRGNSYVTRRKVTTNETLLFVPFSAVISIENVKNSPLRQFMDDYKSLDEAVYLALFLLKEKLKGESSRWASYLADMGEYPPNLVFLLPEMDELIRGSYFSRLLRQRTDTLMDFMLTYEDILTDEQHHEPYFTYDELSVESFGWAIGQVWARSIVVYNNTAAQLVEQGLADASTPLKQRYMVPVLDSFDICETCTTTLYTSAEGITLMAGEDYPANEVMKIGFPNLDMYTYMYNYGTYFPPQPSREALPVQLEMDADDLLVEQKQAIGERYGIDIKSPHRFRYKAHDIFDTDILKAIRLKYMNNDEMTEMEKLVNGEIISMRNEFVVMKKLYKIFSTVHDLYTTTIEEDQAMLALPTTIEIEKKLRLVLIFEKEIIQEALEDITTYWKSLLSNESVSV